MIRTMHDQTLPWLESARKLHAESVVVDSHCDTTQRMMPEEWDFSARHKDGHVDIPRLREGGIDAVVMAVYAPGPMPTGTGPNTARAQLDAIERNIRRHAQFLAHAKTAADVQSARTAGKIAILTAIEGGYLIDESLEILREFRRRGAVYMTLTHGFHTAWADSSGVHDNLAPLHRGLTPFGRDVVREMNQLGMMVDVSHVSDSTFWHVVESSAAPVIASHSSCRAVAAHRRNLSDDMIVAIAKTGGVVQINFAAAFLDPTFPTIDSKTLEYWSTRGGFEASPYAQHVTPLSILADHFDHAIELVGPDHVGIGSDFDGVSALPRGMEDASKLVFLTAELLRRGHAQSDLTKVLGGNFLRVLTKCQSMARSSPESADIVDRACAHKPTTGSGIAQTRPRLVLASASPRRAQLLAELGYEFEIVPPLEDEPPVPHAHANATKWAEEVSTLKARSVASALGRGLILAGDTIAILGDRVIGKPVDRRHAEEILRSLAGTTHQVVSALTLLDAASGRSLVRHDVTKVRMRALSDQEIADYLDSGEWEGKAGAYGIQDYGDRFVEQIEGSFSNVVGLPVELLERMLREWQQASQ